ncbi:aminotransferase class I/II-fold pyridoxal phosphate-dependent enzyme [Calditrichota bacterium]
MTIFKAADRLNLPAYPFADLERQAAKRRSEGKPLYNLSIGDPDLPPPQYLVDAIKSALEVDRSHLYPSSVGDLEVRKSVAVWFKLRFNIEIDPVTQVCLLIGGKEGLTQISRAVVNPGDVVAVPDPAYPVYARAGCQFVDGRLMKIPLNVENGFLPALENMDEVRLLFLNYPNNPTGAMATDEFMLQLGKMVDANKNMTLAYDMAYSEVWFDRAPRSILEFTSNAVEVFSLSKMANATGYRIGFVVGEPERISAIRRVKEEVDSGAPLPFQMALKAMLDSYQQNNPPTTIKGNLAIIRERKQKIESALKNAGYRVFDSPATFYVWFETSGDETKFVARALHKGVLLTPGSGFGEGGKGWARASVTASEESIDAAAEILASL